MQKAPALKLPSLDATAAGLEGAGVRVMAEAAAAGCKPLLSMDSRYWQYSSLRWQSTSSSPKDSSTCARKQSEVSCSCWLILAGFRSVKGSSDLLNQSSGRIHATCIHHTSRNDLASLRTHDCLQGEEGSEQGTEATEKHTAQQGRCNMGSSSLRMGARHDVPLQNQLASCRGAQHQPHLAGVNSRGRLPCSGVLGQALRPSGGEGLAHQLGQAPVLHVALQQAGPVAVALAVQPRGKLREGLAAEDLVHAAGAHE